LAPLPLPLLRAIAVGGVAGVGGTPGVGVGVFAMIGGKPGDPDVEPDGDPLCAGACGAPAADPLPPFCA